MEDRRRTVGVREAAAIIGIGQTLMWGIIREGAIPHLRIGGRVLVQVSDLDAYLASQRSTEWSPHAHREPVSA